jgi:sugar phosphate isomerase/epimerase
MRILSLHQLTALDAAPIELVQIAGRLGLAAVCLFTHVPERARHIYPCVGPAEVDALRDAMAAAGITISNLEVFPLDRDDDPGRFDEALAVGAALGATRATVHVHDADLPRAIARFGAFCDRASDYGIAAGLEFNAFSAVTDAGFAETIVREAGRANGRIVADLLHHVRSEGSVEDLARIADLVDFAQLCDGPATIAEDRRWHEAVSERMLPGAGAFPLAALLRTLQEETVIDIECPQKSAAKAGVSAFDRCHAAADAARAVLAGIDQ